MAIRKYLHVGLGLALAFSQTMGASSARAEDGEALEPVLEPVSVTATRNPIDPFEYPGMVTVLEPEGLKTRQASTPDDLLKGVPNVEFTGGPRRTGEVPSLRGFSGPDVIITLDGARQNFDSGHDGRFFIDPSLVRDVEVLRGPASSLYGSGGMGGVIAFRTVRAEDLLAPGEKVGMTLSGGYQSVNRERLGTVIAYGRPGAGLDLLASVTRRASGAIKLGDGSELDRTDDDIVAGLAKAGWRFDRHQRFEASFQRFSNEAQEPNNGQGTGSGGLVEKDIRADNLRFAYGYKNPANPWIDLDLVLYRTEFRVDELRLDDQGTGPRGELLKRDVDTLGLRLDNRSRVKLPGAIQVTFTYGGEAYRDRQDGGAGPGERDGVPDAEADFAGVFGQTEIRIPRPLGVVPGEVLLIPGLRYDRYRSSSPIAGGTEDRALSPRLGVSYLPTPWSLLFAHYGAAFRAPTVNELFPNGVHFRIPIGPGVTNRFVPNPDLAPQRTRTLELGAGLDFRDVLGQSDRLRLKAAHFRIRGEDFIDLEVVQPRPFVDCNPFIPGACDGTTRAVNVADARLWGNEIEASYENRRLRAGLGFSTIDGENRRSGEKLGVLMPPRLALDVALKLAGLDALAGWRMLAAGEFDKVNNPADRRGGYAVHDFYFVWTPREASIKGLRIDLGVDNAFDKAYSRVFTGALEPGRNFKARIAYTF